MTITSSTITGNTVRTQLGLNGGNAYGGGVAVGAGTHTITHSTISANRASGMDSFGGNLYVFGSPPFSIDHTIVANGVAEFGPDISSPGAVQADHSLIEATAGLTINGAGNVTGSDPALGPLGDNGGQTPTLALLPGSPAVDAGAVAFVGPPVFDQRGDQFSRIADGNADTFAIVDIGAYERQTLSGPSLVVDSLDDDFDGDFGAGDFSLREAIGLTNGSVGPETITFEIGLTGTILLTEGELTITDPVSIVGPGAKQFTVEAFDPTPDDDNGDGSRVFRVDDGTAGLIEVSMRGLTLTGGDVSTGGGAIFSLENLTVAASHITGNSVASTSGFLTAGGGVYSNNGDLTIDSTTISNNTVYHDDAAIGGGIAIGAGDLTITSSTISGNTARTQLGISGGTAYGGGVGVGAGTHTIAHSTISGNRAIGADSFGGGVSVTSSPQFTFDHTIVANGIAESGQDISSPSGPVRADNSLIETTAGLTIVGAGNVTGSDPNLGPLADNGGPTQTHALLPGSAAIDAGQFGISGAPAFDQRGMGFDRIVATLGAFAVIDIGAFELQPVSVAGDYNDSGLVEQGDLDLVLSHWGAAFNTLPAAWINQRPTEGIVDQAELDVVLQNWGNTSAPTRASLAAPVNAGAESVPTGLAVQRQPRRSTQAVARPQGSQRQSQPPAPTPRGPERRAPGTRTQLNAGARSSVSELRIATSPTPADVPQTAWTRRPAPPTLAEWFEDSDKLPLRLRRA